MRFHHCLKNLNPSLAPSPDAPNPALDAQAAILARPASDERRMADAIRALAIDAVEKAKSGHPGLPTPSTRSRPAAAAMTTPYKLGEITPPDLSSTFRIFRLRGKECP